MVAICDHIILLSLRELKPEMFGKALQVTFDLLIQALGGNAVEIGKVGIEQHFLPADEQNFASPTLIRERILAWYSRPNDATALLLGSTPRNRFGIYDLHGLIWEWTLDFNSDFTDTDSGAFCGNGSLNVVNASDYAKFMRYSFRSSLKANYATANLGFRCVRKDVGS